MFSYRYIAHSTQLEWDSLWLFRVIGGSKSVVTSILYLLPLARGPGVWPGATKAQSNLPSPNPSHFFACGQRKRCQLSYLGLFGSRRTSSQATTTQPEGTLSLQVIISEGRLGSRRWDLNKTSVYVLTV